MYHVLVYRPPKRLTRIDLPLSVLAAKIQQGIGWGFCLECSMNDIPIDTRMIQDIGP